MSELANVLRAYEIVLDGDIIGRVRNGKEVALDVPRGTHHLHLEIDWCRSNAVEIEVGDDEVVLECGSNYTGLRLFRGVGEVLGGGDHYLWLRRVDPTG